MPILVNWNELEEMPDDKIVGEVFSLLARAAQRIQFDESDDPDLLGVVPRLTDMVERRESLSGLKEIISSYARSVGLWNYIDKSSALEADRLVAEAVTVPALENITLHREQIAALNVLFAGRNLVLSAPTSFGKSLLIDALVRLADTRK